jgi:hypothetical protein
LGVFDGQFIWRQMQWRDSGGAFTLLDTEKVSQRSNAGGSTLGSTQTRLVS